MQIWILQYFYEEARNNQRSKSFGIYKLNGFKPSVLAQPCNTNKFQLFICKQTSCDCKKHAPQWSHYFNFNAQRHSELSVKFKFDIDAIQRTHNRKKNNNADLKNILRFSYCLNANILLKQRMNANIFQQMNDKKNQWMKITYYKNV